MSKNKILLLVFGLLILGAITTFLVWPRSHAPEVAVAVPENGLVKGFATAPVLVEVFSDFTCSHCADAALGFEKETLEKYLEGGQIRLQYRNFLVGGIQSYNAAVAAVCAGEQNKFWPYHDKLFAEQKPERSEQSSQADISAFRRELEGFAVDLGLDATKFRTCLYEEKTAAAVVADHRLAEKNGIKQTPTFMIGGEKVEGASAAVTRLIKKNLK